MAKRLNFFFESAEQASISRFEPDDMLPGQGMVHQKTADFGLTWRWPTGALAYRYQFSVIARAGQDWSRSQIIKQHHLRRLKTRNGFQGQQLGIARARTHKGYEPLHDAFAIMWKKVPVTRPRYEPVSATATPSASVTHASAVSVCSRIVE